MKFFLLTLLSLSFFSCHTETIDAINTTKIAQYAVDSLIVEQDTVSFGDSTRVKLGIFLDCTNTVTRIDTTFMSTIYPYKVNISIFGTTWIGPGPRPLCPARISKMPVEFLLPKSGTWIIEASEPPGAGEPLRDTIFVK